MTLKEELEQTTKNLIDANTQIVSLMEIITSKNKDIAIAEKTITELQNALAIKPKKLDIATNTSSLQYLQDVLGTVPRIKMKNSMGIIDYLLRQNYTFKFDSDRGKNYCPYIYIFEEDKKIFVMCSTSYYNSNGATEVQFDYSRNTI